MKKDKRKKPNESAIMPRVEDAFLRTPVASACDCTGFVVNIPADAAEAEAYEDLCNVPVTPLQDKD